MIRPATLFAHAACRWFSGPVRPPGNLGWCRRSTRMPSLPRSRIERVLGVEGSRWRLFQPSTMRPEGQVDALEDSRTVV